MRVAEAPFLLDQLAEIDALRGDGYSDDEVCEELEITAETLRRVDADRNGTVDPRVEVEEPVVPSMEEEASRRVEVLEAKLKRGPTPGEAHAAFQKLASSAPPTAQLTMAELAEPAPSPSKMRLSTASLVDRVAHKLAGFESKNYATMSRADRARFTRLAEAAVKALIAVDQDVSRLRSLDRIDRGR